METNQVMPSKAPHFFTNVFFDIIPEVNYYSLEEISQLSIQNQNESIYLDLREALIKLFWSRLCGINALQIDSEFINQYDVNEFNQKPYIIQNMYLQSNFEKIIFEMVIHTKSALDAIATFLNRLYSLSEIGGNIDLKKPRFRRKLIEKEIYFENLFNNLGNWLDSKRKKSDSIISLRDFWIHQSTPWIIYQWPPNDLGVFLIPKDLNKNFSQNIDFWNVQKFIAYHYENLTALFNEILNISINKERTKSPNLDISHFNDKLNFFLFAPTLEFTITKIEVDDKGNVKSS